MSDDEGKLETWLRRMKWALACLPDIERDDIVAETRAHLSDRVAQGTSMDNALAEFDSPEIYAGRFVEERELSSAIGSQRPVEMLVAVAGRAHRSLVAALAFVIVFALGMCAFVAVLTAIVKIQDPVHAGLWTGPGQLFLGIIDHPGTSRELLGNWIYALAALGVAVAWLVSKSVLVWTVKRLGRTG